MGATERGWLDGTVGVQAGVPPAAQGSKVCTCSQLPHAPLMKVLGLPPETNPDLVVNVLLKISEEGPHRAVALVRQSPLMELLPPDHDATLLAASLLRLARMSQIESVMQSLRR